MQIQYSSVGLVNEASVAAASPNVIPPDNCHSYFTFHLKKGRDVAGMSSVTPDKINAVSVIKKLLDNITRRQQQLDDLWRTKKTSLEQALQLQVFEKSMQKVGGAKQLGWGGRREGSKLTCDG